MSRGRRVLALRRAGSSYTEIALLLNAARQTVRSVETRQLLEDAKRDNLSREETLALIDTHRMLSRRAVASARMARRLNDGSGARR